MLRVSVVLTVLISMVGATADRAEAQRFTPFRNLGRSAGIGWGQGYHFRNPGPNNPFYSSWSDSNIPRLVSPEVQGRDWESDFDGTAPDESPHRADPSVIQLVPENDVIENAYKNGGSRPAEGKPAGVLRFNEPVTPKRPASYLVPTPGQSGSRFNSSPSKFPNLP